MENIGARIRYEREAIGLSLPDFARRLGVTVSDLDRIERNVDDVSLHVALALRQALGPLSRGRP